MRIEKEEKKNTVLSDDSLIYSKREERSTRATFKSLDRKEKWQFFKDYILKKLLLAAAILALLVYALVTIFGPKIEPVFYSAVFANPFTESDLDSFKGGFERLVVTDPEKEGVYFDTGFSLGDDDTSGRYKFVALLAAGEIDSVIAAISEIRTDANSEALFDLRDILPADLYKRVEDRLVWIEPEILDYETGKADKMASAPYAIDITDFVRKYSSYDLRLKYYYSVMINASHKDNAVRFIEYMMDCLDGTAAVTPAA